MKMIEIRRRVGGGQRRQCSGTSGCPDVLELLGGDFAVIGEEISERVGALPEGCGIGIGETIVRVPRDIIMGAANDLCRASDSSVSE